MQHDFAPVPVTTRRQILRAGAAGLVAGTLPSTQAQSFPGKPITLIVPYGAGGPVDIQLRALATAASKELGQPILINNLPGAGGSLGPMRMVNTAAPDGHTLAVIVGALFRLPHLQKVDFHPINDFTYVIGLTGFTFGVAVSAESPWRSLDELLADAKKRPRQISAGASGRATVGHIITERLGRAAGAPFNFVPYKGAADMMQAMLGRHLDVWVDGGFGPGVDSGKIRLLATAGDTRAARWPNVPTLKELGYDIAITSPWGLAGPKGMDRAVVQVLHDAFRKSMSDPAFLKALDASSQPVIYMNSADYSKFAAETFEQERRFVRELDIKLE